MLDQILRIASVPIWIVSALLLYYYIYRTIVWWQKRNPYAERRLGYWGTGMLERAFEARTLTNFRVPYSLRLTVKRVDNAEFKQAQMLEEFAQQNVVEEYNQKILLPLLEEKSWRFRFGYREVSSDERDYRVFHSAVASFFRAKEDVYYRDLRPEDIRNALRDREPLLTSGCEVRIVELLHRPFSEEMIKRNYAMLTEQQKEEAEQDERYIEFDEMLAIAAYKRRLDFFSNRKNQTHDTSVVLIETEMAGRGLKIKWRFKDKKPSGYDLVGMRTTGGFFHDKWDDQNNGVWIIQSSKDGETTEFLAEGETYFYTFILRPINRAMRLNECPDISSLLKWLFIEGGRIKPTYGLIRFQVTIETSAERAAIQATLARVEKRQPTDARRKRMFEALKSVGLAIQHEEALDEMEKSLVQGVKNQKLPKEEEERKIKIIEEIIRQERSFDL